MGHRWLWESALMAPGQWRKTAAREKLCKTDQMEDRSACRRFMAILEQGSGVLIYWWHNQYLAAFLCSEAKLNILLHKWFLALQGNFCQVLPLLAPRSGCLAQVMGLPTSFLATADSGGASTSKNSLCSLLLLFTLVNSCLLPSKQCLFSFPC